MKKLSYALLIVCFACAVDPEPVKHDDMARFTCWPDAWSLLHNAPAGPTIPFGTTITYNVTPAVITVNHKYLQYSIKVKNLGPVAVLIMGTFTSGSQRRLNSGESYTTPLKPFEDCSLGTPVDYLTVMPTVTGQAATNVVVTLVTVNAPHTIGTPSGNSMVFQ